MRVTAQLSGQFLARIPVSYTGTYLTAHLEVLSQDNVRYFRKSQRLTPR